VTAREHSQNTTEGQSLQGPKGNTEERLTRPVPITWPCLEMIIAISLLS
jgi:hypothetical protein